MHPITAFLTGFLLMANFLLTLGLGGIDIGEGTFYICIIITGIIFAVAESPTLREKLRS